MRLRDALLVGPLALGLALTAGAGCASRGGMSLGPANASGTAFSPPLALPPIELRGLDDKPVQLDVAAAGQPALVSFWATWCDACVNEMDALNRLNERAHATGGVVIGVAVGETREKAAAFVQQRGLKYAQLVDEKLALADALGQKRLPATLVLDRSGKVVYSGGTLDERALAAFRTVMSMGNPEGGSPKPLLPSP